MKGALINGGGMACLCVWGWDVCEFTCALWSCWLAGSSAKQIHSKIISEATVRIIGKIEFAKIEFLPLDWI